MTVAYIYEATDEYGKHITLDLRTVASVTELKRGCQITFDYGGVAVVADSYYTITALWRKALEQQERANACNNN